MVRVYRTSAEAAGHMAPSAVTIGNFDGVHVGHLKLFKQVVAYALAHGCKPTVLTFDPHPTKVVAPSRAPRLLITLEERIGRMEAAGIQQVLVLPFDRALSEMTPAEFLQGILVDLLGAKAVFVGENFRFGNRQSGDTAMLRTLGKTLGYETHVIPGVELRGRMVSSSEVRRLLEAGQVSLACRLLNRPYSVEGNIVSGHGIGSKQTVPTLNLESKAEILPRNGVYITRTHDLDSDRTWPSITNIGTRPTFDGQQLSVETYLLTPLEGESPKRIRLEFLRRVRDERKFENAEQLKRQIIKDAGRATTYFRRTGGLH